MPPRRIVSHSAAEDRLYAMLEERLQPGADVAAIDARIWELFGEEWCMMATDLSGFSRGVARHGIIHFLQTIYESERILVPVIERHDGIVLKAEGDSLFIVFRTPAKGVAAAIDMQRTLRDVNAAKQEDDRVLLGIGLGFGRVLRIGDHDVFGAEMNSACILGETHAAAYEILATQAVRERAGDAFVFEDFPHVPPGAGAAYRVVYSSSSDALNGD